MPLEIRLGDSPKSMLDRMPLARIHARSSYSFGLLVCKPRYRLVGTSRFPDVPCISGIARRLLRIGEHTAGEEGGLPHLKGGKSNPPRPSCVQIEITVLCCQLSISPGTRECRSTLRVWCFRSFWLSLATSQARFTKAPTPEGTPTSVGETSEIRWGGGGRTDRHEDWRWDDL